MKTVRDFPFMELGVSCHIRDYHREQGPFDLTGPHCTHPGCVYVGLFRGTGRFGSEHPGLGRWNEESQEWEAA